MGGPFITDKKEVSLFRHSSCISTITAPDGDGGTLELINNPKLVKKLGKQMNQICTDGSSDADKFIRAQAQKYGIPVA